MPDHPVPLPISEREIDQAIDSAFDDSQRTIPLRRNQMFSFDHPAITVASEESSDPVVRLERKIEAALKMIAVLQKKIDSLDEVLAKAIHRLT